MGSIFKITEHANFGKLLEAWANGREARRPTDPQAFKELLAEYRVTAELPSVGSPISTLSKIKYVDLKNGTLLVTVPTKRMIKVGLDEAVNGTTPYPFPQDYDQGYGTTPVSGLGKKARRNIFYARIGDYAIGSCM